MRIWTKIKIAAASAALCVGVSSAANAATCQFGSEADFDLQMADVYTSKDCIGEVAGNDSNQNLDGYFGFADWGGQGGHVAKVDGTSGTDGKLTITSDVGGGSLSGTWSVTSWTGVKAAMIVLKASNSFAAYLIDITEGTSGEWMTTALETNGGNQPAISHISLYEVLCEKGDPDCEDPPGGIVPVPAGLPLLLSAMGIVGIVRAHKRKSA